MFGKIERINWRAYRLLIQYDCYCRKWSTLLYCVPAKSWKAVSVSFSQLVEHMLLGHRDLVGE